MRLAVPAAGLPALIAGERWGAAENLAARHPKENPATTTTVWRGSRPEMPLLSPLWEGSGLMKSNGLSEALVLYATCQSMPVTAIVWVLTTVLLTTL